MPKDVVALKYELERRDDRKDFWDDEDDSGMMNEGWIMGDDGDCF